VTSQTSAPPPSRNVRLAIPWVTTAARLVLGVVMFMAGWLKVGSPAESVQAVRAYQLLPESLVGTVGYALPYLEIIVGVLLVLGLLTRVAALGASLLMLAFVFGISWAWAHGLRIDCGCFGGGGQLSAWEEPAYLVDLLRDFGLVLLGVWIMWFPSGRFAVDSALGLTGGPDGDEGEQERNDDEGDEAPDTKEKN